MPRESLVRLRNVVPCLVVAAIIMMLVSCALLESRVNADTPRNHNEVAGMPREEPADPAVPEGHETDDPDAERETRPANDEIELEEYSPVAVFNLAYNQTFFPGGYWVEEHGFEVGEAVRWRIVATDHDAERGEFEAERALVEVNPDGSQWWYIRYSQDQYRFECEVLLDEFETPVEMWHREAAEQEPTFHEFDYEQAGHFGEADGGDLKALEAAGIATVVYLSTTEYQEAKREQVTLRVPAGEFQVDRLVYELDDSQTRERFSYEWWLAAQVPGDLVRFHWLDHQSERELSGELLAISESYDSPFDVR